MPSTITGGASTPLMTALNRARFHDRPGVPAATEIASTVLLMMLLVRRKKVMGELQVEGWLYWLGWLATIAMGLSVVGMAFSLASSQG